VRFVIYTSVLNGDDALLSLIDRLIDRVADEVHVIDVPDVDLLQESVWYQQARLTRRKLLMSAVARPPRAANVRRGPHVRVMELFDAESAKRAEKLAHTPLVILVEDRESDGVLLDLIVEELGWPELKALWAIGKTVTPRALEIETAGGKGAIPQRIERAISNASEENRPSRLFVVFDSHAKWPNDNREERLRAVAVVRETCATYDVPYHVLRKRCAENYIPDQVFESASNDPRNLSQRDRFNAFLRRSRVQRDYFPIKDGMTVAERLEAIRLGLYDVSEEKDLALLERSLLPRRPRPLLLLNQERRDSFTEDGLRERDGEGELDSLLQSIAQEL
jgi:hypothetical protein